MRLNPAAFNRHLAHMGQDVLWRRAYACPCKNSSSGASDPRCQHCGGKGHLWDTPHGGVVGITGTKVQREWAQFGTYESGDSVVSIGSDSPLYAMGQADRVTLMNATEQFSLRLVHGAPVERLIGKIVAVNRVFWLNAQKAIVEGGLPQVQSNGSLVWAEGEPPLGTQYTISGTRHLEYFCWGQFPSNRNMHQGAALPRLVVLRRFDLWGRSGG
jgi:hypothetical protein